MAEGQYINVYFVERVFGGPEEGGWYYETGRLQSTVPFSDAALCKARDQVATENEGRRPLSSVLSTGMFVLRVEDEPGQSYPTQKPVYE